MNEAELRGIEKRWSEPMLAHQYEGAQAKLIDEMAKKVILRLVAEIRRLRAAPDTGSDPK